MLPSFAEAKKDLNSSEAEKRKQFVHVVREAMT